MLTQLFILLFIFAEKFTEMDIIANAILLLVAGAEPVSDTLAFCFYELALNKPIQDKLRQHIFETREKHGGEFNHNYLANLHYADMVLLGKYSTILEND